MWQNCRTAKEKLFNEGETAEEHPVTLLGAGASVVGGAIKATRKRADLERIVLEGFLPEVSSHEKPLRQPRIALHEVGLPYAADPAITRHLARFLRQAAASEHASVRRGPSGLAAPTHVLFNGGVFRAGIVRGRLLSILNGWLKAEGFDPAPPLEGEDLMHAVSRGAAYYGLARLGGGVRIRGGIPRTYYIGVAPAMPAVPGMPPPLKALTVAQFGMEEGARTRVSDLQLWCVARDGRRWKLEFNVRQRAGQ